MMRHLIEIASKLDEYQKLHFYNAGIPGDPSDLAKVDRLNTQIGWVDIHEREDGADYSVVAVQANKVVAALEFVVFGDGYAMLQRAASFIPRKGLATSLVKWVRKVHEYKIVSDTSMTDEGEAFWHSLMALFGAKIINLETGKTYPLSMIDGVNVIDPKRDNKTDYTVAFAPDGQRWFYLIEGVRTRDEYPEAEGLLPRRYVKGYALTNSFPMSLCEGVVTCECD